MSCRVPNCIYKVYAKGLCRNHYELARRLGSMDLTPLPGQPKSKRCEVCNKRIALAVKSNRCRVHKIKQREMPCSVPGCTHPCQALNLCRSHASRDSQHRRDKGKRVARALRVLQEYGIDVSSIVTERLGA